MLKFILCASLLSLLAGCSNFPATSASRAGRASDTSVMGGPAGNDGFGPGGYWEQTPAK